MARIHFHYFWTYFYFAAWHPSSAVHSLQSDGVKLALIEVHQGYFCCLVLGSLWATKNKLEVIPVKNSQINFMQWHCSVFYLLISIAFYSLHKITKWSFFYIGRRMQRNKWLIWKGSDSLEACLTCICLEASWCRTLSIQGLAVSKTCCRQEAVFWRQQTEVSEIYDNYREQSICFRHSWHILGSFGMAQKLGGKKHNINTFYILNVF